MTTLTEPPPTARHIPLASCSFANRTRIFPADPADNDAFEQATIRGCHRITNFAISHGLLPTLRWSHAGVSCRCGTPEQRNAFRGVVRNVVDKYIEHEATD